ncbi:MAG: thymidylate synthase [Candidatus Dojkabacteria bacterium]
MKQYLDSLQHILDHGKHRPNRTGVDQIGVFGMQMRFDMADGFPAVTTKKLFMKGIIGELLWFISGSSDNNDLNKMGIKIWDGNANADYWKDKAKFPGDLGRVYGVQWRHWRTPEGKEIDQLALAIEKITKDPFDRRIIVTAWNPGELDQMALPPCHLLFQFYIDDGRLSLQMYQRSCDMFLGIPFNIASYALLLHMVAQVTDLKPGEFVHTLGDAHIYENHIDQVKEQLGRKPYALPKLKLNEKIKDIDAFTVEDIELGDYKHHPSIKAKMAV